MKTVTKLLPGCALALVIAAIAKLLESLEASAGLHLIGASVIALFIGMLVNKISLGGYIHCATDWENYAEQMMEVLSGEPKLKNLYDGFSPVMGNPIAQRPQTKFQARGERLGHGIWDLVFTRI